MRSLMNRFLVLLGAGDPEMNRIEEVARKIGCQVAYMETLAGERVRGPEAYQVSKCNEVRVDSQYHTVIFVECRPGVVYPFTHKPECVFVDHHNEGDVGFGVSPERYMEGSSLGQFLALFGITPQPEDYLYAASDHCPAAAYRGRCPGVDPIALKVFRASNQAKFQGVSVEVLLEQYRVAAEGIKVAPRIVFNGVPVADIRDTPYKGAPEASLQMGVPILCMGLPDRDGTKKVNLLGDEDSAAARFFKEEWAEKQGYVRPYGDPARGFAGAYIPKKE